MKQIKHEIISPVLVAIGHGGTDAVNWVAGVGNKESGYKAVAQEGGGPARGFFQIEPPTELDQWHTYLNYPQNAVLATAVRQFLAPGNTSSQLYWNVAYGVAICRIKILRHTSIRIPSDAAGMARVWKSVYNSSEGAGEVTPEVINLFQQAIDA